LNWSFETAAKSRFARHDFEPDGSIPRRGCELNLAFRKPKALRIVRAMDADPPMAVRSFWNYCLDRFSQGAVHYDQVDTEASGDWLLDSGWGDCQLVSALFASMCWARGIPARILGGFYLYRTFPLIIIGPKRGSTVRVECRSIFPVGNCRAAARIRHGAITSSDASTAA